MMLTGKKRPKKIMNRRIRVLMKPRNVPSLIKILEGGRSAEGASKASSAVAVLTTKGHTNIDWLKSQGMSPAKIKTYKQ